MTLDDWQLYWLFARAVSCALLTNDYVLYGACYHDGDGWRVDPACVTIYVHRVPNRDH
jgi:hypothetical protein